MRKYVYNRQCRRGKDSVQEVGTEPRIAISHDYINFTCTGMNSLCGLTVDFPVTRVHAVHVSHLELCWYMHIND